MIQRNISAFSKSPLFNKNICLFVVLLSVVLLTSFVSAYKTYNVEFNGEWENGAVLKSDFYQIYDGNFYAKNAYPIKNTEKVCTTTFKDYKKRVCETEIIYKERTRKVCKRIGATTDCEIELYQYPTRKITCRYEVYQKPRTTCKYVDLELMCENPSGVKTNALLSENFQYQVPGGTWEPVPTSMEDWSFSVINQKVRFKVTIPEHCTPEYDINKAVVIQERQQIIPPEVAD